MASSVNKHRSVLSAVLATVTGEKKIFRTNPVHAVRAPKPDVRKAEILTDAQYELLIAACGYDPALQAYLITLGESGARASEPLGMQVSDVNFDTGFIEIGAHVRTKSGRPRKVPMTKRLRAALAAQVERCQHEGSEWLFNPTAGGRYRRLVKKAAASVGIAARWHLHDLRHRYCTKLLASGKGAVLVGQAAGHASLQQTLSYYDAAPEHLLALIDD
jgi:integrase